MQFCPVQQSKNPKTPSKSINSDKMSPTLFRLFAFYQIQSGPIFFFFFHLRNRVFEARIAHQPAQLTRPTTTPRPPGPGHTQTPFSENNPTQVSLTGLTKLFFFKIEFRETMFKRVKMPQLSIFEVVLFCLFGKARGVLRTGYLTKLIVPRTYIFFFSGQKDPNFNPFQRHPKTAQSVPNFLDRFQQMTLTLSFFTRPKIPTIEPLIFLPRTSPPSTPRRLQPTLIWILPKVPRTHAQSFPRVFKATFQEFCHQLVLTTSSLTSSPDYLTTNHLV